MVEDESDEVDDSIIREYTANACSAVIHDDEFEAEDMKQGDGSEE